MVSQYYDNHLHHNISPKNDDFTIPKLFTLNNSCVALQIQPVTTFLSLHRCGLNRFTRCVKEGSVRILLRRGGQFYRHFTANSLWYLQAKIIKTELSESDNFLSHSVHIQTYRHRTKLTKSGSVNSFCGSSGSAGASFRTMLAVFDIINPDAKSHTEYNFYKQINLLFPPTNNLTSNILFHYSSQQC